ncbi:MULTISPECIES: prepilin peptidase [Streptomyces]|uniref:prepilin peptidase n=1 Tax=Streptomyces TaxID=1883 RepID=UPI0022494510|nr:A24 family peptidase [Streptomyces sp. JHD 1]MCX2969134.1 A24 family peptidase [Streptomyces sp. JHD 1]
MGEPGSVLLAAGYGAVAGGALVRPAYRLSVPTGRAWRATCPAGHPLAGWAGPGRCPQCAGPAYGIARRWLAVPTAAVCAGLAAAVGPRPELAVWLLLAPPLVLLATVDLAVHRLPDVLTLPLAGAAAALLGVAALLPGAGGDWPRALLGGAALCAGYGVLFLIHPRGMGFGDVKLAAACGVALGWYGWPLVLGGTYTAFVLGATYGLVLIGFGRAKRRTPLPFGPFMIVGTLLGVAAGGLGA